MWVCTFDFVSDETYVRLQCWRQETPFCSAGGPAGCTVTVAVFAMPITWMLFVLWSGVITTSTAQDNSSACSESQCRVPVGCPLAQCMKSELVEKGPKTVANLPTVMFVPCV